MLVLVMLPTFCVPVRYVPVVALPLPVLVVLYLVRECTWYLVFVSTSDLLRMYI